MKKLDADEQERSSKNMKTLGHFPSRERPAWNLWDTHPAIAVESGGTLQIGRLLIQGAEQVFKSDMPSFA